MNEYEKKYIKEEIEEIEKELKEIETTYNLSKIQNDQEFIQRIRNHNKNIQKIAGIKNKKLKKEDEK